MGQTIIFGLMLFVISHLLFGLGQQVKTQWGGGRKRKEAVKRLFEQDVQAVKNTPSLSEEEKAFVMRLLEKKAGGAEILSPRRYQVGGTILNDKGFINIMLVMAIVGFAFTNKALSLSWWLVCATFGMQILIHLVDVFFERERPFFKHAFEMEDFFTKKDWEMLQKMAVEEGVRFENRTFSEFTSDVVSPLTMIPVLRRWHELQSPDTPSGEARDLQIEASVQQFDVKECEDEIRRLLKVQSRL